MNKITKYTAITLAIFLFLGTVRLLAPKTIAKQDEESKLRQEIVDIQEKYAEKAEEKRQYAASCVMETALSRELTSLNAQAQSKRDQINALKTKAGKVEGK